MEQINMVSQQRVETGKCPSRRLRKAGRVPAILYGAGIKGAIQLSLNNKELEKVLHTGAGENVLINLSFEGDKDSKMVMLKEITRHPLKESIEHVDLLEVLMDKKVHIEVPIHLVGKAAGLAFGGIVQQETRKVKVECLPDQIPGSLDADITSLEIGQALHISDIVLPEGVKALNDMEETVVSIVAPVAEVEEKTAEEVEEELAKSFEDKDAGEEKEEEKAEKKDEKA
ncbi:MAG: 50S ribosomal protein L25 [Thermodesulfobacteriota bacterium]